MYPIEVMSIGGDFHEILSAAANRLNKVQSEFRFHLTSDSQRAAGERFVLDEYSTEEIWNSLEKHRETTGGNRPYIIAFINKRLKSAQFPSGRQFGSHRGKRGLAVATLYWSTQYTKEEVRYCCYFMIRYALSFVNPSLKSHDYQMLDAAGQEAYLKNGYHECYFHRKEKKPEIRAAMDAGRICDDCRRVLNQPPDDGVSKKLSAEEWNALDAMRAIVSGDIPHAVVMKGGGVKGLAFAGALVELQRYFWFDRHVGVSAGAITAVLLAGDYKPAELIGILRKKEFREFKDASWWKLPINYFFKKGLYPGDHFTEWLDGLLRVKNTKLGPIMMKDLNGALICACQTGMGTLVFDSKKELAEAPAAYATRCSMSIPYFFIPASVFGKPAYDGGLRNNFPLKFFLDREPTKPFVALYLGGPEKKKRWFKRERDLLDIIVDGEERTMVDQHRRDVVVIDTSPIGTIDFGMSELEKDFLLKVGRAAALRFLKEREFDDGPDEATVNAAHEEAETARAAVHKLRKGKRWGRLWKIGLCGLFVGALTWLIGSL
jgi:NTE family protein